MRIIQKAEVKMTIMKFKLNLKTSSISVKLLSNVNAPGFVENEGSRHLDLWG